MRQVLTAVAIATFMLPYPTQSTVGLKKNESRSFTSLRLKLSGPSLVATRESPNFRAVLINDSNQNIELPSPESLHYVIYLQWKVTDLSEHTVWTRWAEFTICGYDKQFTDRDFLALKSGQQLELPDINFPELIRHIGGTGRYKISLRYAFPHPDAVLLSYDIVNQKTHFDVTSNELIVLFAEK